MKRALGLLFVVVLPPCLTQAIAGSWSLIRQNIQDSISRKAKRPITVADAIQMRQYADPAYTAGQPSNGNVAHFSPDGGKFIVVLKRGNIESGTSEYSLHLWQTTDAFRSPTPDLLLTLSSSSNREAIKHLTWLDNETIGFLGENPGESQQLFTLNTTTKELRKLTSHPTSLVAYAVSGNRDLVALAAEPQIRTYLINHIKAK
jgi:hypothetical protein